MRFTDEQIIGGDGDVSLGDTQVVCPFLTRPLISYITAYYANFFFLAKASAAEPIPKRAIVAGSGTAGLPLNTRLSKL